MASLTTFYFHVNKQSYSAPAPSGFLGTWDQIPSAGGVLGKALDGVAGTAQTTVNPTWASSLSRGTVNSCAHLQCLSQFLAPQTISVGNWTIGFSGQLVNAAASHSWGGSAFIGLVNGTTGALRTTILATSAVGSTGRTSSSELTCYATTLAGSSATVSAGDYLVVELGIRVSSSSIAAFTPNSDTYQSGTGSITSDAASTSNAQSFIMAPQALVLNDFYPFKRYYFFSEW